MKNKVLKRLFSFAVILVIALSLCFGFVSKEERITVSADVPTDNLDPDITLFDIENYPSANYFDVTKISLASGTFASIVAVSNGIVNSVVIVSHTLQAGQVYYSAYTNETLSVICPNLRVGELYTLSLKTESDRDAIYLRDVGSLWYSGTSLVVTQDMLNSRLGFFAKRGVSGECTISEIMINKGTEAYPYFPYYYSFYNAGVDSGYNDGLSVAAYGFLYDPEVVIRFNNVGSTGENRILNTTVSTYTDSGFSFSQFRDRALTTISPYTSCQSIEVILRFSTVTTMKRFALDLYSDYLSNVFIDDNTDLFYAQLDHSEKPFYHVSLVDFSQLTESSVIYEFGMEFSNGLSALNSSIYVSDVQYDAGFRNGYDAGKFAGYDQGYGAGTTDGYDEGYDEGYDVGVSDGHQEGYNDGYNFGYEEGNKIGFALGKNSISGDNLSNSVKSFVFSLFDAPVSTFMGVFNFEYDGFDIGALVAFIFSMVIVASVLKVVL